MADALIPRHLITHRIFICELSLKSGIHPPNSDQCLHLNSVPEKFNIICILHQDVIIRTCAPHRLGSSWLLGSVVYKTQLFQKLLICPHAMSMGFYYERHTGSVEFLLKANRSPAENKEKPSGERRLLWSVMFSAAFQHRKTGITFSIKVKKCSFQRL